MKYLTSNNFKPVNFTTKLQETKIISFLFNDKQNGISISFFLG